MVRLLQVLWKSFLDLFQLRMLMLLLVPPLASLFLWGVMGYVFWDQIWSLSQSLSEKVLFHPEMPKWILEWIHIDKSSIATAIAWSLAFLLIIPLGILTSMLVTAVIVMPVAVGSVQKSFPALEKKGTGLFVVSTQNAIQSSFIYLVVWVLSLPLWVIPGMGVALPLLLNGYLNYRLLTFDALADFATEREVKALLRKRRADFLLLGVITSSLILFPPFFLVIPIYSALCFARLCLLELSDLRSESRR